MYGNNEKKLTQREMQLTCDNIRQEFNQEIDIEHRRINIDSSKKKAVLFHYDYEGFRQMVLGANLYTIKSKELQNLAPSNEKVFNNQINRTKTEEQLQFEINLKQIQCKSFRDFRTQFQKVYQKPINEDIFIQTLNLLQAQTKENVKQIFSIDFQIQYFFQILEVLDFGLNQENGNLICFIIGFFNELLEIKDFMTQIKKFLKKSEKEQLVQFFEKLQQLLQQEFEDVQINQETLVLFQTIKSQFL
ncbi:hypothetical protein pb186bvf_012870 [Paramecium bursaria]